MSNNNIASRDKYFQFYRNGRWGTCGFCPRDDSGTVYPEFCTNTDRYDHQLSETELAARFTAAHTNISIHSSGKISDHGKSN